MYQDFAFVYDRLTDDVNYQTWASYIEEIFERNHVMPEIVLDLGCGTGSLTVALACKGFDMIGLDLSEEMLGVASEKAVAAAQNILLINQDMCEMELFGTVGAVVSTMDSLNYLSNPKSLKKVFALVHQYLDPGGFFIFDVHSKYKMEKVFGDHSFHLVTDDISYIWNCHYDGRRKVCTHDITCFVRNQPQEPETYIRFDELHEERFFTKEEIETALTEAHLKLVGVYDGPTFRKTSPKSERWLYVCKKET
ncbi:MAG: methyltransferase domain-containing protein [Clostridia bacterium]